MDSNVACKDCFLAHRNDQGYLECKHATNDLMDVTWNEEKKLSETNFVRPVPRKMLYRVQEFIICNGHQCRGEHCLFPHGQPELKQWNSELRG